MMRAHSTETHVRGYGADTATASSPFLLDACCGMGSFRGQSGGVGRFEPVWTTHQVPKRSEPVNPTGGVRAPANSPSGVQDPDKPQHSIFTGNHARRHRRPSRVCKVIPTGLVNPHSTGEGLTTTLRDKANRNFH